MPKPARTEIATSTPDARRKVRVWDLFVRVFHWALVAAFVVAWLTRHDSESVHYVAGYAAAGLVTLRVIWGIVGTRYARFRQFSRGPRTTFGYLRDIATGREARYIGHNPAGGAMIVLLIVAMAGTACTGWLCTTDAFWGVEWMARLHERIADGLLILVLVHIGGVILASVRHHENLVLSMFTGLKREPEPGDVAD